MEKIHYIQYTYTDSLQCVSENVFTDIFPCKCFITFTTLIRILSSMSKPVFSKIKSRCKDLATKSTLIIFLHSMCLHYHCMCFEWSLSLHVLSQTLHLEGFSSVCVCVCQLRLLLYEKALSQYFHLCFFPLVCLYVSWKIKTPRKCLATDFALIRILSIMYYHMVNKTTIIC